MGRLVDVIQAKRTGTAQYGRLAQAVLKVTGGRAIKTKTRIPTMERPDYPALRASSEIVNTQRRLEAAGQPIPGPGVVTASKGGRLWRAILWALDRPRAMVTGALLGGYEANPIGQTPTFGRTIAGAAEGAWQGLSGQRAATSRELLETIANRPDAAGWVGRYASRGAREILARPKLATGVELGMSLALDPTTYLGLGGAKKAAEVTRVGAKLGTKEAIARRIAREVRAVTKDLPGGAKTISRASAMRLTESALRGRVPVGRLGVAVRRAMGEVVEKTTRPNRFKNLVAQERGMVEGPALYAARKEAVAAAQKAAREVKAAKAGKGALILPKAAREPYVAILEKRAAQAAEAAKAAREAHKSLLRSIRATPPDIAEYVSYGQRMRKPMRILGQTVDIAPVTTALGAVVRRVPGGAEVVDALGRMFRFNYTPLAIRGGERMLVTKAKDVITRAATKAPTVARRTMRETIAGWRGTTGAAAKSAAGVIEETLKEAGPETLRAAEKAKALFAKDVALYAREGMPLHVLDNYVTHLYMDPPEVVREVLAKWRGKGIHVKEAKPFFTLKRTVPTMEQAKALGLHPVEDVRVLTAVHRALSEQAAVFQRMGRDLIAMGEGVVSRTNPGGWVAMGDEIPALAGKYVHPEVATTLRMFWPVITNTDEGIGDFVRGWKKVMDAWTGITLATPNFNLRNLAGSIFLNMCDGLWNPGRYHQATAALVEAASGFAGKVLPELELAGRRVPTRVVMEWFENAGLPGQGVFRAMLRERKLTEEATRAIAALKRGGMAKVAYFARHPFEALRGVGETADTWNRLANFLHHLDQGFSPDQAAELTRLAQFDYGRLTAFEKNVKRWAVPFYPWKRFVLPRMIETLIGSPGILTGTVHMRDAAVSLNDVDETHLPEWLVENQAIPLWVDAQGNIHYLTLNLPYTDLAAIHDPRDIQEWGREIVGNINPFWKAIAEVAGNRVFYTGQSITSTPGLTAEAAKDFGRYLLENFGGMAGRELASSFEERQRAREPASLSDQEVPPYVGSTPGLPFTTQNPARWARSDLYARRDILRQAVTAAERRGITVPTTEEIPPSPLEASQRSSQYVTLGATAGGPSEGRLARVVRAALTGSAQRVKVGEAPAVVRQAVGLAKVSRDWEPWLTYLMDVTSGGNPVAYDPKTQRVGLFFLTRQDFERYKAPGYDDIWDPVANTLAAIRQIRTLYGHPSQVPGLSG